MDKKICNVCNVEKYIDDFYIGRKRCKKCFLEYAKNNPNFRHTRKKYYKYHREEIREKYKTLDLTKYIENKRNNPNYVITQAIRVSLNKAILKQVSQTKYISLLGCSLDDCRKYIESKFKCGMTWDNHGNKGWHFDHIIPCSSFDLLDIEEQKKCFHYTNMQPLWWNENLEKGAYNESYKIS